MGGGCESRAREGVQRRCGSSVVIIYHRPECVGTREQPPPPPPPLITAREFHTVPEAERSRTVGRVGVGGEWVGKTNKRKREGAGEGRRHELWLGTAFKIKTLLKLGSPPCSSLRRGRGREGGRRRGYFLTVPSRELTPRSPPAPQPHRRPSYLRPFFTRRQETKSDERGRRLRAVPVSEAAPAVFWSLRSPEVHRNKS